MITLKPFVITVAFLFYFINDAKLKAQSNNITISNISSTDVYEIQNSLGDNGNYHQITSYMDSLINNGIITDTTEDGNVARYGKWDWFWKGRVNDVNNPSTRGDFSNYLKLMNEYSKSSLCPENFTSVQYNWDLKGPIENPINTNYPSIRAQVMGRVDLLRTLSPFSQIAFAGTPTSGLWRTNNYLVQSPVWVNITDGMKLPNIGIKDMAIHPTNSNIAYISAGYTGWTPYSMGLFKTVNLNSILPTWTSVLAGPTNEFNFSIPRVLLSPSNS